MQIDIDIIYGLIHLYKKGCSDEGPINKLPISQKLQYMENGSIYTPLKTLVIKMGQALDQSDHPIRHESPKKHFQKC